MLDLFKQSKIQEQKDIMEKEEDSKILEPLLINHRQEFKLC